MGTYSTTNAANAVMMIDSVSCYKPKTNNPSGKPIDFDDINDSELDLLLDDLELEEEISESENEMKWSTSSRCYY